METVYTLCNIWKQFHAWVNLNTYWHVTCFHLISWMRKLNRTSIIINVEIKNESSKFNFYTLPYSRDISEKSNKKFRNICEEFSTETKLRLSFTNFFVKGKLVDAIKAFIIYRFSCPGCNARCIRETMRMGGHITKGLSHLFKHLEQFQNA